MLDTVLILLAITIPGLIYIKYFLRARYNAENEARHNGDQIRALQAEKETLRKETANVRRECQRATSARNNMLQDNRQKAKQIKHLITSLDACQSALRRQQTSDNITQQERQDLKETQEENSRLKGEIIELNNVVEGKDTYIKNQQRVMEHLAMTGEATRLTGIRKEEDINRLQQKLEDTQQKLADTQQKLADTQQKLADAPQKAAAGCAESPTQMARLQKDLQEEQSTVDELQKQMQILSDQLHGKEVLLDVTTRRMEALEGQNLDLATQLHKAKKDAEAEAGLVGARVGQLEDELRRESDKFQSSQLQYLDALDENSRLNRFVEQLRIEKEDFDQEMEDLERVKTTLEREKVNLEQELRVVTERLDELEANTEETLPKVAVDSRGDDTTREDTEETLPKVPVDSTVEGAIGKNKDETIPKTPVADSNGEAAAQPTSNGSRTDTSPITIHSTNFYGETQIGHGGSMTVNHYNGEVRENGRKREEAEREEDDVEYVRGNENTIPKTLANEQDGEEQDGEEQDGEEQDGDSVPKLVDVGVNTDIVLVKVKMSFKKAVKELKNRLPNGF